MKFELFIDKIGEEKVQVFAKEENDLVRAIKDIILSQKFSLVGYIEREGYLLKSEEVDLFLSEDGKTFALVGDKRYKIKERLYTLEEHLSKDFVRINQSCLVNTARIKKFDASFSGSLTVKMQNGYCDYVSRRNLKAVKERLGIK